MTQYNGFKLMTTLRDFPKEILFEGTPTPRQLEIVEEIAESASNTREGLINGLEGVGNLLSHCAEGNTGKRTVDIAAMRESYRAGGPELDWITHGQGWSILAKLVGAQGVSMSASIA